jgi:hypothetical protein
MSSAAKLDHLLARPYCFCILRLPAMALWINNRLPTQDDADLQGMILWGKHDGFLMNWRGVRSGEYWAHSSAWKKPATLASEQQECLQ